MIATTSLLNAIGVAAFAVGLALVCAGVVGIVRFPSIFDRIKALSVINGLGAFLLHASGALLVPGEFGFRGLLTAVLFLIPGPAVAQVLAACAYRHGLREGLAHDDLAERDSSV